MSEKQDAIEKGIFLTPYNKRVHACKIREDLGIGITRCGLKFLVGHFSYKSDATFGDPPQDDSDGSWSKCDQCAAGAEYKKSDWLHWKKVMKRTLAMIGTVTQ